MKFSEQMEFEFKELERKIQKLKQIEMKLNTLNVEGFEYDAEKIESKLKKPTMADGVEMEFNLLERKILEKKEEERKLREEEKHRKEKERIAEEEKRREDERKKRVLEELRKKHDEMRSREDERKKRELEESRKEALEQIKIATNSLEKAEKLGLPVQEAKEFMKNARYAFDSKFYKNAKKEAQKCVEFVDTIVKKYEEEKARRERELRKLEQMRNEAAKQIETAKHLLEKSKKLGNPIPLDAQQLLNTAQISFSKKNYATAKDDAQRLCDVIETLIEESKPNIALKLPSKMRYNYWEEHEIITANNGTAHAKHIIINFSEALEITEPVTISKLNAGEQKSLCINVRPTQAGKKVPVNYSIKFGDMQDRTYETKDITNIQITFESVEREINQENELKIKRTIYDPVIKDFISQEKLFYPEVSKWLKAQEPPDYWYILRIDNPKSIVEQWAVELSAQKAVSVKEAYIDGIDCTPLLQKEESGAIKDRYWKNKYIFSVPKERGFPLPSNGVRRLYFRLNIDCNIALQPRYSISGNVIADDVTMPIIEKDFPFSCEIKKLKALYTKKPEEVEKYLENRTLEYKSIKNSLDEDIMHRSAYYCCELFELYLNLQKAPDALKYCLDMLNYASGETREEVRKLTSNLEYIVKEDSKIGKDLLKKATVITHQVRMGWGRA